MTRHRDLDGRTERWYILIDLFRKQNPTLPLVKVIKLARKEFLEWELI